MSELFDLIERAHDQLSAACRRGRLRMSVPARPDEDDDLVISSALDRAKLRIVELEAARDANALLEEIQRNKRRIEELEAANREMRQALESGEADSAESEHMNQLRQRIAELEAALANPGRTQSCEVCEAREKQLAEMQREMRALATPIARAVMLDDFEDVLDRYFPPEDPS